MTFQHPMVLLLLLALIPMALVARFVRLRRERRLSEFAARETWPVLNTRVSATARRWKAALLLLALAFTVLAAARPMWGTRERTMRGRGIDIVVAMDVSMSMLATDMKPNRLEEAKTKLRQLLALMPGQRVAIVPFAGDAFLQCPLTADYGIAMDVLQNLSISSVQTQGTNIAAALAAARQAFGNGATGSRALILITDGENHEEKLDEQIDAAAREGIIVYALGIGSAEGSPVYTGNNNILEDNEGHKVVSRLDVATLQKMTERTGGVAFVTKPGATLDIRPLVEQLKALEKGELGDDDSRRVVREERFQIPLAIALVLFLAEGLIGERRGDPRKKQPIAAAAALAAMMMLFSAPAFAISLADDYKKLVDQGIAAYQKGDYEAAETAFRDARMIRPEGEEALMNLALAQSKIAAKKAAEAVPVDDEKQAPAKQELPPESEDARSNFSRLIESGEKTPDIKATAHYNRGRLALDLARAAMEKQDRETALRQCLSGMEDFDAALKQKPDYADAKTNRTQMQRMLEQLAVEPPPQQQQQQQQKQDQNNDKQSKNDEQQQSPGQNQEDNKQNQNEKSKDQQGESGDKKDDQQKQDKDQEGNEDEKQDQKKDDEQKDGQAQEDPKKDDQKQGDQKNEDNKQEQPSQQDNAAGTGEPRKMSEQEARNLLNLLGNKEMFLMRRGRSAGTLPPEKQW